MAAKRRRNSRRARQTRSEVGHQAAFVLLVCFLALAAFAIMLAAAHP